ncbi:MAG: hypothetical protein A2V58_02110 [Candidatus Muproteobacteria bacterium RBG_19FT_COMBO_61_10]|jgi:hypothetical protein|uniref:Uncharacterized protein n=1 Tax=Candidatus Muproteobacteria bacterium RBG_19FT_COMBO_61_10 TaxID=1817761 RepID=A0A1F6UME3_9PROT|nr:MAG: hypothetical protein A2V58_02110 [Candidatus Muproteobacteria bacterium RBG_19FT_COMBO_61_10]
MDTHKHTPDPADAMFDESRAERLLEGLYEQRNELGEVAEELVKLLLDAGVPFPDHLAPARGDEPH